MDDEIIMSISYKPIDVNIDVSKFMDNLKDATKHTGKLH